MGNRRTPWLVLGVVALALTAGRVADADLVRDEALDGIAIEDLPRYEIDQAIDDVSGTFAGRLALRYVNATGAPLDALPLLFHPNAPVELGAVPGSAGSIAIREVTGAAGEPVPFEVVRPTLAVVRLPRPVAPGEAVALEVRYEGRLRVLDPRVNDIYSQGMASMGSLATTGPVDYGLLAQGDGILTMASAYPMVAPWRDGAFDTSPPARVGDIAYNGVATFRVRTIVGEGVEIVTNLVDRPLPPDEASTGTRAFLSEGTLVRDLVLVAGRDLARESVEVGGTRVTCVFRARDREGGLLALDAAAAALASFERRFGEYPYRELDVVEASLTGGAGGVEFSALVLVAGMLYRSPDQSTSPLATLIRMWEGLGGLLDPLGDRAPRAPPQPEGPPREALEFTVAHEVAHQYFAGIVGLSSHGFPTLDEPLAQYAAGLAMEDRYGRAAAEGTMDRNVKLNYALYRLLGGADRPVLRDTQTFRSQIEYAGLVYGKAPYLYAELRRRLGDERLHGAIREAVRRFRFQVVTTPEWVAAVEEAAGGPRSGVRATFRAYLEEARGDRDLGVDDSGDFVLDAIFPPDVAATLRGALPRVGIPTRDFLRMIFGGGLSDEPMPGPGFDPSGALDAFRRFSR